MANENEAEGRLVVVGDTGQLDKQLQQSAKGADDYAKKVGAASDKVTQKLTANERIQIESEKRLTQVSAALAKERVRAAENEGKKLDNIRTRARYTGQQRVDSNRGTVQENVTRTRATEQRATEAARQGATERLMLLRNTLSQERDIRRNMQREVVRDEQIYQGALNRARQAPTGTRERILQAVGGDYNRARRQGLVEGNGLTYREAFAQQFQAGGFNAGEAAFLAGGFGAARPVSLGGRDVEGERATREAAREAKRKATQQQREIDRDTAEINRVIRRSLQAPLAVQQQILNILKGPQARALRQNMMSVGATPAQAIAAQLGASGFAPNAATFLAGGGGARPPSLGGKPPASGGGFFGRYGSRILGGAASALGIGVTGFGAYGAIQGAQALVESTQVATAYERQQVAAEGLAGSQQKLNALLDAYNRASGGAVDKVTALNNVTRLLATGYAKTVTEAERFVRATRGASIALGRPQEEITQETQLAISNTSIKRLDQIGLGIDEVTQRIEQLRKANANWSRETAFQESVLSVMEEKYGHLTQTLEGQATGIERLTSSWANYMLALGQGASGPLNTAARALSKFLDIMANASTPEDSTPTQRKPGGSRAGTLTRAQQLDENFNNLMRDIWYKAQSAILEGVTAGSGIDTDLAQTRIRARQALASGEFRRFDRGDRPEDLGRMPTPNARFDENVMAGLRDFRQAEADIEVRYHAERLAEIDAYEQQRTNVIRNYEKQIAREAEDFAIRRARSERDYRQSVEELISDSAKRDEEMVEDYTDRISEAREDSEKRISEIEKDYQKQRETDLENHRDRLLKAAGALDAIAVLEERKRWRRENREREEAHREQLQETRDALDEQLEDLRKAHIERLEDAREADRERLEDMRKAREQQIADEDADRAIQLERLQEDHDEQLAELDRQHDLRMKQIDENAQKEREAWQTEFEDFLVEHNIYVKGLTEKRKKIDELTEGWLDKTADLLEKKLLGIEEELSKDRETTPANTYDPDSAAGPKLYARGGHVGRTGPAILHAGEYVLSRGMLTGSQPVPANIADSVSNSKHIEIHEGAIVLQALDPGDLLEQFDRRLIEILDAT